MKKILVAMSGGVDSAVTAFLMKEQGYDICGATLILNGNYAESKSAEIVCSNLGIDFIEIDKTAEFKALVIDNFIDCYCNGTTPNPCIVCNKTMKFGLLYDEAIKRGFDGLATGHYAQIFWDEDFSEPVLRKGKDSLKDQSYVLYSVEKDRFKNVFFPLGHYSKSEVRNIAQRAELVCANKSESQDICFIEDGDYAGFICEHKKGTDISGDFVNSSGKVLGKHKGLIHYTVGQRRGLGVSGEASYYVLSKNADDNTVVLGFEDELKCNSFSVKDVNILCPSVFADGMKCKVRTRYHQAETECTVHFSGESLSVETDSYIRIPAPGQSAVFYIDDRVIGGGIIR